jgi:putative DNA primase/helicase
MTDSLPNNTTNNSYPPTPDASSLPKGQTTMPDSIPNTTTNTNPSMPDSSNLKAQFPMPDLIQKGSRSTHFCTLYTPLLSDFTNASRFAKQYSHQIRFVRDSGWFLFDGTRWHLHDSNHIFSLAASSLQSYYDEAAALPNKSPERLWERLLKHAERSQSLPRLKAMLRIASQLPELSAPHTIFDADPSLLTVLNGTLNLFTGELLPHNPDHFITRLIPLHYDPQAHSPVWDDFLNRITDTVPSLKLFLQYALGYSLTGITNHHLAFLLSGPGHHAQDLLLSLFRTLLGDYASHAPSLRSRSLTSTHLTSRFLTIPLATSLSKHECSLLTSLIKADPFPLHPSQPASSIYHSRAKLWLASSESFDIPTTHASLREHLTLIPISLSLSPQDIHKLAPLLQEALPAILAWAVQGAQFWYLHGLPESDQVLTANAAFRDLQDDLSPFLESACTLDPARFIRASDLYEAYHLWSLAHNYHCLTSTAFGRLLQTRSIFHRTRDMQGRLYHGLSLTLSLDQLTSQLKSLRHSTP